MVQTNMISSLNEKHIDMGERLILVATNFVRYVKTPADGVLWCANTFKLFSSKSILFEAGRSGQSALKYAEFLWSDVCAESAVQSSADFDTTLAYVRKALDGIETINEIPVVKKFGRLLYFMFVNQHLSRLGLSFDKEDFSKAEYYALSAEYSNKKKFMLAIADSVIFTLESIRHYQLTGTWSSILHKSASYNAWLDECELLKRQALFLANPAPHGFTRHDFTFRLDRAIEDGNHIVRFSTAEKVELKFAARCVNELQMIRCREIARDSSVKTRRAPFAILVAGSTSIGKSQFADILHAATADILKLPKDLKYRFVRDGVDPYWTNFSSCMWSILFDDVAKFHPNICSSGGDPSSNEMIGTINNVPYMAIQAALEDKGTTPVLADLVVATTNVQGLNAHAYFSYPVAVLRRFPFIVRLEVKDEYANENKMLDKSKIPDVDEFGSFPDFWNIFLQKAVPDGSDPSKPKFVDVAAYTDIRNFLTDYERTLLQYHRDDAKRDRYQAAIFGDPRCQVCRKFLCECKSTRVTSPELFREGTEWNEHELEGLSTNALQSGEVEIEEPVEGWHSDDDYYQACFELHWSLTPLWQQWIYATTWFAIVWTTRWCSAMCYMFFQEYFDTERRITIFTWLIERWWFRRPFVKFLNWYTRWFCDTPFSTMMFAHISESLNQQFFAASAVSYVVLKNAAVYFVTFYSVSAFIRTFRGDLTVPPDSVEQTVDEELEDSSEPADHEDVAVDADNPVGLQGGAASLAADAREPNIWHNDDLVETGLEFPKPSACLKGQGVEKLVDVIKDNLVHLQFRTEIDGKWRCSDGCGFFLRGHLLAIPKHFLDKPWTHVKVTPSIVGPGVNSAITVPRQAMLFVDAHTDLVVTNFLALPPRKDLIKYWIKEPVSDGQRGRYYRRTIQGLLENDHVYGISFAEDDADGLFDVAPVLKGFVLAPTRNGSCGSLLMLDHPRGPVIAGFHYWGGMNQLDPKEVRSWRFLQSDLQSIVAFCETKFGRQIEAGPVTLSSESAQVTLSEVHYKHPLRFLEDGCADVKTGLISHMSSKTSAVVATPIQGQIVDDFSYVVKHGPPVLAGKRSWIPLRKALTDMLVPKTQAKADVLDIITRKLSQHLVSELETSRPDFGKELVVLTEREAINGIPGVAFVDKLNRNTSMGFPWNKTKKAFEVEDPSDIYPEGITYTDEILGRSRSIRDKYRSGCRANPVFKEHLKDEARPLEKCRKGETRVFTGGPGDWSIIVRMYLLSFVRLLQMEKYIFMSAPGTVSQSVEWDDLYRFFTCRGFTKWIFGDYSKFDKRMAPEFIIAAFEVIIAVHRAAGWPEEDLIVLRGIAEDIAYNYVCFHGALIQFYGTNPSGHPLTVIINCLVGILYVMYAYFECNPSKSVDDFWEHVRLMTYGDDNGMSVSDSVPWFNHMSIAKELGEIGVIYTTPTKEAITEPYMRREDISFLKRTWRFDADLGRYVAPLEEDSIMKSLTVWIPSSEVCPEKQMVDIISSAVREYFWYGKGIFELRRRYFINLVSETPMELFVQKSTFPTYDELKEAYWAKDYLKSDSKWLDTN